MARRPIKQVPVRIPDLPQHRFDAPLRRLMEVGDAEPEALYTQIAHTLKSQNQSIASLVAIALDESYTQYADKDEDDPRGWTRVHAVRVLEQMGEAAQTAIEPLLPLLSTEDDWLREEMPIFYSIVGVKAMEPLTRTIENADADPDLRIGAADALVEIAEKQPSTRAATITLLERCLAYDNENKKFEEKAEFDADDTTPFADFIVCLMNLGACDSYSHIKAAFERGVVDEFIVGLDEVEEHFGLPITPRPVAIDAGESEIDSELSGKGFVSEFDESGELEQEPQTPYVAENKVGRNEPCPCGSGQKYKKCCGK